MFACGNGFAIFIDESVVGDEAAGVFHAPCGSLFVGQDMGPRELGAFCPLQSAVLISVPAYMNKFDVRVIGDGVVVALH